MKQPTKWKMALLTWLCIYPLINLIFFLVMPHIASWHPLLKTLLTTAILVPLMGALLGVLQRRAGEWLYR
jgi:antibiotic biosynthesis monooxygenase (ABM) superfamily enzyme